MFAINHSILLQPLYIQFETLHSRSAQQLVLSSKRYIYHFFQQHPGTSTMSGRVNPMASKSSIPDPNRTPTDGERRKIINLSFHSYSVATIAQVSKLKQETVQKIVDDPVYYQPIRVYEQSSVERSTGAG